MPVTRYLDFRVELDLRQPGEFEVRLTSPFGETERPVLVRVSESEQSAVRETIGALRTKSVQANALWQFGRRLAHWLLPDNISDTLVAGLARLDSTDGVRLRVVTSDPWLSSVPWEYLHLTDASGQLTPFLALDPRISIVRHEKQGRQTPSVRPLRDGVFRLLVIDAAQVPGLDRLSAGSSATWDVVTTMKNTNVEVRRVDAPVSRSNVEEALRREQFDAIHFLGHSFGGDNGGICLDGEGHIDVVTPQHFAALVRGADVRLVVLASCDSGAVPEDGAWVGLTSEMIRAGVPAVVSMQHAVEDAHATSFEGAFYAALAASESIDAAVASGRRAMTQFGLLPEWGVPVLHTRTDGVLFSPGGRTADRAPERKPIDFGRGLELERAGEWSRAADYYVSLRRVDGPKRELATLELRIAACEWRDGDVEAAEARFEAARKLAIEAGDDRTAGEVDFERGRLAEEEDRLIDAKRQYERALSRLGDDPADQSRIQISLASIERRMADLGGARARLDSVGADTLPDNLRATYLDVLGAVQLDTGEYAAAIQTLNQALELDEVVSEHLAGETRLLLAETYLAMGDRDAAEREVSIAKEIYDEVDDHRGLFDSNLLEGQIVEEAGQFRNALSTYRRAATIAAGIGYEYGEARAYRLMGRAARRRGDFDGAEEFLDHARDMSVRSADPIEQGRLLTEQAYLDLDRGEYDDAIDKLRSSCSLAGSNARALAIANHNLAVALSERGNLDEAVRLLLDAKEALVACGDMRELERLLDDLAEVLLDLGRFEDALAACTESLKIDETIDAPSGRVRSLLLLGRTHIRIGRLDRAREYLEDAMQLYDDALRDDVGRSDVLFELGQLALQVGNRKDAIDNATRALRIERKKGDRIGEARCHRLLATIYRRNGDLVRAYDHLEDAEAELANLRDPIEQALLDLEHAELQLVDWNSRRALERANEAHERFQEIGAVVYAATARSVAARAYAQLGDTGAALRWLTETRQVFHERGALAELDECLDDIGEVHLERDDLEAAQAVVRESLVLDRQAGLQSGRGRSELLLGDIDIRAGKPSSALDLYQRALTSYEEAEDDIGMAESLLRIGSWHADNPKERSASIEVAIRSFKDARRLFQLHQATRGVSRAHRKLGEAFSSRSEFQRAEEAYEEAEDFLKRSPSERDLAPLLFAQGALAASMNDHERAVTRFERALELYSGLNREERVNETRRRLATCYQQIGSIDKSLGMLGQIGREQNRFWTMLVTNFDEEVARSSASLYREGEYARAVTSAVDAVRRRLREYDRSKSAEPDPAAELRSAFARTLVDTVGELSESKRTRCSTQWMRPRQLVVHTLPSCFSAAFCPCRTDRDQSAKSRCH